MYRYPIVVRSVPSPPGNARTAGESGSPAARSFVVVRVSSRTGRAGPGGTTERYALTAFWTSSASSSVPESL